MHLVFGPLALTLAFNGTLFSLSIGCGRADLQIGRDGQFLDGYMIYGRNRVGRGEVAWQWCRGVGRYYKLFGGKNWEGSRYWTDADLPPVQPLNIT